MLIMGRYDAHSKYNVKNVTRYMKERKQLLAIPYNTLYFELYIYCHLIHIIQNILHHLLHYLNYLFE